MTFSSAQAARFSSCTVAQLRHWSRRGLLVSSGADGTYTFRDVVALRVVRSLLDAGLSSVRVVVAVQALREIGEDDLASLRLVTDGRRVWACHDDGQILDALAGGQLALFIGVDQVAAEVGARVQLFEAEKAAFVDRLVQPGEVTRASDRARGTAGAAADA